MSPDHEQEAGSAAQAQPARRRSELTREAFDRFLDRLNPDRDLAGAKYLEIHKNLERFFEWRGCPFPTDHADEAITRTAQRLAQGDEIKDPATYVVGVARLLLLEIHKEREKDRRIAAEQAASPRAVSTTMFDDSERRAECLHRCLDRLPSDNRQMILLYYEGEKSTKINNRKKLTETMGVGVSTLRMRALRIRERLTVCVETCITKNRVMD
jgi:DNA-directed RNA polymerase specialized sigma24 family protein